MTFKYIINKQPNNNNQKTAESFYKIIYTSFPSWIKIRPNVQKLFSVEAPT